MTPISAASATAESVNNGSMNPMPTNVIFPSTMPNTNSPSTAGCLNRSKSSPPSFAAMRIATISNRVLVIAPVGVVVRGPFGAFGGEHLYTE